MQNPLVLFTDFLNHKTESILGIATAMAIGAGFKDLITSVVSNLLQPLIVKLILLSNINRLSKFSNVEPLFTAKNSVLNISNVIGSILSFIFIVTTVYIVVRIINNISVNVKNKLPPNSPGEPASTTNTAGNK